MKTSEWIWPQKKKMMWFCFVEHFKSKLNTCTPLVKFWGKITWKSTKIVYCPSIEWNEGLDNDCDNETDIEVESKIVGHLFSMLTPYTSQVLQIAVVYPHVCETKFIFHLLCLFTFWNFYSSRNLKPTLAVATPPTCKRSCDRQQAWRKKWWTRRLEYHYVSLAATPRGSRCRIWSRKCRILSRCTVSRNGIHYCCSYQPLIVLIAPYLRYSIQFKNF